MLHDSLTPPEEPASLSASLILAPSASKSFGLLVRFLKQAALADRITLIPGDLARSRYDTVRKNSLLLR
jgi:hypothetical protein